MKTRKENQKEGWLKPNLTENRSTTFSQDPAKDRDPLIGKTGITATTLRPTGEIRIKGRVYDAVAEGTFVEKDEHIRVTGTRDFRLIVEKIT